MATVVVRRGRTGATVTSGTVRSLQEGDDGYFADNPLPAFVSFLFNYKPVGF